MAFSLISWMCVVQANPRAAFSDWVEHLEKAYKDNVEVCDLASIPLTLTSLSVWPLLTTPSNEL